MAKIVITADTESDELQVTVNGQEVADIQAVSIYKGRDWYGAEDGELNVNIQSMRKDKENGVTTMTTICASDTHEGQQIRLSGAKSSRQFPEFVVLNGTDKVKFDILEWFNRP